MNPARDRMLEALRAGRSARAVDATPLPDVLTSAGGDKAPMPELVARFQAMLAKVGAAAELVDDHAAAAARVAVLLAEHNARRVLLSDAPEVAAVMALLPTTIERLGPDAARDDMLAADAGLTAAQWAIAETGTLVLESTDERHRLASLLPELHVALVPCSRLLPTLGDAFARLHTPGGDPNARTLTFVTGPSRTADIELELVVGVHGPKHLHVLLLR
jgi:L-lactate dehydrogenase complex protein LldG